MTLLVDSENWSEGSYCDSLVGCQVDLHMVKVEPVNLILST